MTKSHTRKIQQTKTSTNRSLLFAKLNQQNLSETFSNNSSTLH